MSDPNDLVQAWRADVASKAEGRTRYEGQEPFWDEAVLAYIDQLEAERDALREACDEALYQVSHMEREHDGDWLVKQLEAALALDGEKAGD